MSFPPFPLFSHTPTPNLTNNRTSATGRVPRLNTSSYSVTSPTTTPTSPGASSSKSRQKPKVQSRPKTHHTNTADSRSKSKAKAESRPKASRLRMRVKRDILIEAPDAAIPHSTLRTERDTSAEDPKGDQTIDEYPDGIPSTEDDETEGEAETDRDTEADTSVEADASHRTLSVDPFSAEEERIITVLSRKLEQLRESETTSPLSPIEASSPPLPFPSSTTTDSTASVPTAAVKQSEAHKSQKRASPPHIASAAITGTLDSGAVLPARLSSHSRTSSGDSGIYAPAHSSPSSVYAAAGAALPIDYQNGSANAKPSARSNGKTKSDSHAMPIAVKGPVTSNGHTKGKGTNHDDGISIELNNNTYNRTYGTHISTLSSPEMSLSTSPCEAYDTRWMGTSVNPNGAGIATANGNGHRLFPSNNSQGRARFEDLQTTTQVPSYEQESEHQTQTQLMLHALMQENDQLKSRMAEMEGNCLRLANLNEAYRVELIEYRSRLGLPVDNLIGLASDPLPESFPSPTRFMSTSRHTHTQNPHPYHRHQHPLGAFHGNHDFNASTSYSHINTNSNDNQYHHSHGASVMASSNSTKPLSATTRNNYGGSHMPSRISNGFGYENGHNCNIIDENEFGTTSANHVSRNTSTNGVPIPRTTSQVHTNRLKQSAMIPMSMPNTDNALLYMHGSSSRSVNEPRVFSTSASYSSPSYSNNSPVVLSPSYSSSYSAASSSAASSSAASSASASTNVTSPPSSLSFTMMMMLPPTFGVPSRGLSYPLVPPPSLSSSLGSGSGVWEGAGGASGNLSPVDPSGSSAVSRRGSNAGMSVGRRGSFSSGAPAGSTGGRVIETGSLRRSRGGSLNHGSGHISRPETVDETEGDYEDSSTLQGVAGIREP